MGAGDRCGDGRSWLCITRDPGAGAPPAMDDLVEREKMVMQKEGTPPQVLEQVRGGDPGPVVGGCLGQSSDLHPCIEWEGGRVWVQIWEACHVS